MVVDSHLARIGATGSPADPTDVHAAFILDLRSVADRRKIADDGFQPLSPLSAGRALTRGSLIHERASGELDSWRWNVARVDAPRANDLYLPPRSISVDALGDVVGHGVLSCLREGLRRVQGLVISVRTVLRP